MSVPLEPAAYDLVAESGDGLKRVQVKMTGASKDSGRYVADISRRVYGASAPRNANGNRRRVSYEAADIDYFFVITPKSSFLIPVDVIDGRYSIVLDEKYEAFAV